jgi:hypothetical protein
LVAGAGIGGFVGGLRGGSATDHDEVKTGGSDGGVGRGAGALDGFDGDIGRGGTGIGGGAIGGAARGCWATGGGGASAGILSVAEAPAAASANALAKSWQVS